ncbi:type IV pilus secretin PilQ [Aromatoleum buckelii]|nr:type IV pilus secretin PilQ [Aromatoleum buckelii]MCK0511587.1 type IV pilus secretin PilQ [Aromatoleum buckelii]
MKRKSMMALFYAVLALLVAVPMALAQAPAAVAEMSNRIEGMEVSQQGGSVYVRLTLKEAPASLPPSFSVATPPRIAFDFPGTVNGLGRTQQDIGQGDLRSANIVQAGDRTRLVLNLTRATPYEARVEGRDVIITLSPITPDAVASTPVSQALANFAAPKAHDAAAETRSIRDITFRRGKDGEARIVVQLSSPDTGIDIRRQGENLVVEFLGASLPEHLRRRSDVTDFATPVTSMTAQPQGDNVRLLVAPTGLWEHNAYQSDNQFVLEVRRVVEDPNKLVQGGRGQYSGEKLSLNFQNIDVRSVLQVIADFTNFNIITSDSVQGNLTLRLKDVPWDQALDIILQAKGLDMRKTGNVIWIAPSEELAMREKLQLEAQAQIGDLEPVQTESFQINYHKAKEIFEFLKSKDQTMLSKRGSVVMDERSNKIFVTDVVSRLDAIRRLVAEIDLLPRQVMIEARIVEANKDFSRDLGVRLGVGGVGGRTVGFDANGRPIRRATVGGGLEGTAANAGQVVAGTVTNVPGGLNVNLPAPAGSGVLSAVLWNNAATRFLNLELSALESDGRGRVISSPRVLTANQVEASIEQGTEIPYQESTSSGATSVSFKKAVLSLKVKPQITPDGRVQLFVQVHKDRPVFDPRFTVPSVNTKNIQSEVLVENGGTVVIGGIYEEEEADSVARIPLLGEVPVVGALFRNTTKISNRSELLIFITPRIVADSLTLR